MRGPWRRYRGFTIAELLVTIFVISLLLSILLPALGKVRRHAQSLKSMSNMRSISQSLACQATDNRDQYPASVASNGQGRFLTWSEPTKMIALDDLGPRAHRSISAYLSDYVPDPDVMYCPSAPAEFKYWSEAWEAQDQWDNPDNGMGLDPLSGTYCFYWNYRGYLPDRGRAFVGPERMSASGAQSKLLVSDYLGYNHWRFPERFAGCERFARADVVIERNLSSSYWAADGAGVRLDGMGIRLNAAYTDGHVSSYSPTETVRMKVSNVPDGSEPFADELGMGDVLLPRQALD